MFIYILILDMVYSKFPNIGSKEIQSQISHWFSGAKDREEGKKERLEKSFYHQRKKIQLILKNIDKNHKYLTLYLQISIFESMLNDVSSKQ